MESLNSDITHRIRKRARSHTTSGDALREFKRARPAQHIGQLRPNRRNSVSSTSSSSSNPIEDTGCLADRSQHQSSTGASSNSTCESDSASEASSPSESEPSSESSSESSITVNVRRVQGVETPCRRTMDAFEKLLLPKRYREALEKLDQESLDNRHSCSTSETSSDSTSHISSSSKSMSEIAREREVRKLRKLFELSDPHDSTASVSEDDLASPNSSRLLPTNPIAVSSRQGPNIAPLTSSNPTKLRSRLENLLPQMRRANEESDQERRDGRLGGRNIENLNGQDGSNGAGRPYIEMDLGLGVLERTETRGCGPVGNIRNEKEEGNQEDTGENKGYSIGSSQAKGKDKGGKPKIEVVD